MSGYKSGMKGADVLALLKNGLPIVDDVSKLDPNAELGSMASVVTAGTIQERSFRDLYQPDMSMLDQTTGTLTQPELLSSVSSINFLTPTEYIASEVDIILVPRSFSQTNLTMIMLAIASTDMGTMVGGTYIPIESYANATEFIIGQVVDGVYTIDDAVVTAINDILASDDWCYLGREVMYGTPMTEEQFATLDKFVISVAGVPSTTDIYVKGDKWKQLYKSDLDKLASDLDKTKTTVEGKSDKITIATYSSWKGLQPNVYTTYSISSTGSVTVNLAAIADTTIYNEYILELKCTNTPSSVAFNNADGTAATIVWANGIAPAFQAGKTYLISIANGFGVYSIFNS